MKHPVLRVKKGKQSYDDRGPFEPVPPEADERRGGLPEGPRRRGTFFRMRRGSLLPVIVLVVIAALVLRSVPRSAARANIAGWHAVLEARVSMNGLDVGVAFSPLDRAVGVGAEAFRRVSVAFVLPNRGEQAEVFGILSGPRVALRSRLSYDASDTVLRAIVTIDGESRTLSLPIKNPFVVP